MKQHTTELFQTFRKFMRRLAAGSRRSTRRTPRLAVEQLETRELLAAAFFAPATPAGTVSVQLDPLANVAPGVQEIVTFGVPFTRGSVGENQLSQIRVLKNGVEIPAFVEQLTPWRSIDDTGIDGQSVRVARIQIPYTFASLNPEMITVQWGGPARTLNRTTMQDPRIEWHMVTSGSFVAADNVQEPDVLPVLPAAYLALGMLDSRTDPTNSGVPETRDNPAVMDTTNFTGFQEYDSAEKNFFYTIINQNGTTPIDYKTQAEPWLYDRSSAMFQLYMRSGFATALREAIRSTDFYVNHLDSSGFFTLKPGDAKYSYNESLAYTYWLLGDNRMLAPISTVVSAFDGTQTHWTPDLSFFTERNTGDKLLANDIAYEVTGNATYKANVQTIVGDLVYLQNGANGQLPANRIDGGLYHYGFQHDITEVSSANVIIASSWMSALVVDPMVRVFGVWQDNAQVPDFIIRMGNFEKAASKTDANGQFGGVTRYPDYLMRTDGTSDSRSDTDVQHAMDVGAVAAWATYFAELRGTPDASLRQLANDLYATYDLGVNVWTSTSGGFAVLPPRRYNWEYKNSASFSWALDGTDAPGQAGTLSFSAGNYSVVENQGVATVTVTRANGSTGSVSVNYATSNGTATAGSDYTATSGTLTFADGETSKTFAVPIINDTAVENAETVMLTLSNPTGGASLNTPATATLTILSDDTTNQPITTTLQQGVNGYTGTTDADISTQYADSTGGNGSTTTDGNQLGVYQLTGTGAYSIEGLIRFGDLGITSNDVTHATVTGATLTLTVDTFDAATLRGYYLNAPWTTAPGTNLGWIHRGTGQDWATPGALGQGTDVVAGKSFVLSGITPTGAQTITVNLDPAVVQSWIDNPNADQGIVLVNETTGAVVRVDASENATAALRPKLSISYTVGSATATPQPGSLQFSNPTYNVNENGGTATITVTRTGGTAGSVSVNYATGNGTATAGSDYTASSGTLTFADGETSKTFTVPITNDTLVEGDETVNLTLSSPTGGATLGSQTTAVLTIADDDVAQPGVLQFSTAAFTVNENQGTATITVTRTGGSDGPVSVNYATSNGTATAGSDYAASSGTLTFAAGETTKTFTVPITNDTLVEGDETINLTLSSPTGGATLGSQTTAVLTIADDDVAQPGVLQFSTAAFTVNENQGTATITVTRTGGSNVPVTVNYATSNGTAMAGSDYTASSGTLTFAAGETTKTFTVPITNDTLVEGNETVNLTLSSPTGGATLGGQTAAVLTIVDDDTNGQPTTVTLQQGVNGYTGTADISITTQNAEFTSGNGLTTFTSKQMGDYQTTGTGSYIVEDLIRFSNLGIPASAAVSGATLTLSVENWVGSPTIRGYYVLAPWSSTPGPNARQLGWLHRGNGQDWNTPGALGQGTDVIAGNSFVLPGITPTGTQSITIHLDPAVVQSWINNPSANQGILLVNQSPGLIVQINTSENAKAAFRPKLTVTYTTGTGTPQPGTLQLSNPTYSVNENGGTATITVTRTGGSDGTVSVNFATSNGTAMAGSDYTTTGGTLTFGPGETSKTFTIPILNDAAVEGNETVNLVLSSPTGGATLGSQSTAVLTIVDDDVAQPGVLQFSASAFTINENQGTATITVTRTGGSNVPVSVNFATSDGTATAGSDYTATSGTLNFAVGETSKTFTIPITNDMLVEGDETVNLTLSSPTGGATLGSQSTAMLTIVDDEVPQPGVLQFSMGAFTVNENQGTATITVTRTGGSNVPVTVDFTTSNGTATAGSDYSAVSGTLTFAAGETSKTFTIPIIDDTLVEGDETVNLTLSNPTGGATLGSQTTAVLTIVDDDVAQPGTVQFNTPLFTVNENQGTATITVTRTGGTNVPVSIDFATSNGTATAGSDYTAVSGTLTFAVGETSKTFTIPITNDTLVEGDETVNLTLSNPTGGATLGSQSTAVLTIADDDVAQPGVLQFSTATYTVNETQGIATITVTRAGGSNVPVSVNFATSNGTATAGSDYTAISGTLNFAVGETSKTFTIPITNDTLVEGDETVNLTLSSPTGGATLGNQTTAVLTIVDDDINNQPTTVTLQQGINGYTGTTDASITTQNAQFTGGNGLTDFTSAQMGDYQTTDANGYTVEDLIRFSNLGIPTNATVNSVTLTLSVENFAGTPTIRGYYVLAPWSSTPGPDATQLGWLHRGNGQDWNTPGALGQGTDVIAGNNFVLPGITPIGTQTITINLDPAVVQSWISNPSANQGILLVNETAGAIVHINTSENATAAFRPKLSVTYTAGTGTPQPGALQLSNPTYSVNENGGTATITVTRTGGSDGSVSVNFATSDGTATAGSDYTASGGTLTFAAGETSKTFTVPITNDTLVEGNETINLTLSSPTGGATLGGQSTAVLTIVDDDVATLQSITVTPNNASIANGQTTQFTATGQFSDGSSQVLTSGVTWSSSNTSIVTISSTGLATAVGVGSATITAMDGSVGTSTTLTVTAATAAPTVGAHTLAFVPFNSPAGSLSTNPIDTQASGSTILAWLGRGNLGSFTSATVPTDNHGNTAVQLDSTHTFAPNFPNSGMALYTFPSFAGGSGDVFTTPMPVNDEVTMMVVEVKNGGLIQDFKWNQVSSGGAQTSLNVTTTGPATLVSFWTGDSASGLVSATPGNGFTLLDTQPASTNSVQAAVATKDVSAAGTYNVTWTANPAQTGYIWLIAVQHAVPPPQPGAIQLSASNSSVNEGQGTATITVNRTGGSDGSVSVHYATSNGTATAGSDYTAVNGTLTFAAGETSKTFTVPIINDTVVEGNETVNVTLSNPTGGATLGSPASGTLTIVDDDTAPTGAFTNVTVGSGIDAIINQQYQQDPNWWLSGEHLVDLDNDGHLDLFLDSHTGGSIAALNDGHGHFTRVTGSFPDSEIHEMFDINGDGKIDLNATFSDGGSQWWINHSTPGHVNFTPTTVTRDGNTSRSQVLFDFNGDGKVDWFRSAEPGLVVDFGDGNGGFAQGSLTFPIAGTDSNDNASFLPADFDGDGKIDLLVLVGGNYDGTPGKTLYWHNNGNMTFTDVTASSGIPANGTIAKGIGDFNQDGHPDFIAIANKSMPPVIYLNDGHGHFTVKTNAISGIAPGSLDYTSWGTAVTTDIDNDGIPDIVMDGKYYLKVLRGTGGGNFTYMNTPWGITDTAAASLDDGLCFGDIDGDGRIDMIGYNETFPIRTLNVYHNDLTPQNYLNVQVVGLAGNVGAAGATISIFAAGTNRLLWDEQVAQYDFQVATSYYAYNQTERHFGLGGVPNVDVVVQFASGKTTRINNVSANQTIQVLESAGN